MIVSKTPYRVGLVGGGTDLPEAYALHPGSVVNAAIQRYVYVTVHPRFENNIRVAYTSIEFAQQATDIKHDVIRSALVMLNIQEPLEITTIGDVPAGTGLGSSSSLAVGILHALHAYKGDCASQSQLAKEACDLELNLLKKPIGKQDQYAAASGGLKHLKFYKNGSVEETRLKSLFYKKLEQASLLFYLQAPPRSADSILAIQSKNSINNKNALKRLATLANRASDLITANGTLKCFSDLINEGWHLKKELAPGINHPYFDMLYKTALDHGALAAKITGAGGGGFAYVIAPHAYHAEIRSALGAPKEIPFKIDTEGSRVFKI